VDSQPEPRPERKRVHARRNMRTHPGGPEMDPGLVAAEELVRGKPELEGIAQGFVHEQHAGGAARPAFVISDLENPEAVGILYRHLDRRWPPANPHRAPT